MNGLLGAVQFLTRVPVRLPAAVPHARAIPWFPVVGLLIGATVGGAAAGLGELLPPGVAGGCAVVVGLLLTGAFHEDGLADVADAFGGGWSREQRFEILQDSRHGTYGVAALGASIVVRVLAAASIPGPATVLASFVAAHVLGRTAIVATMLVVPPAAESGLGADAARSLRPAGAALSLAAGLAISGLATGWWLAPLAAGAAAAVAAVVWLAIRKLGGIAGDVLGAVEQVVECAVLVVASGLALRHPVWWA